MWAHKQQRRRIFSTRRWSARSSTRQCRCARCCASSASSGSGSSSGGSSSNVLVCKPQQPVASNPPANVSAPPPLGTWRDWPVQSADSNFELTRVFGARYALLQDVLLLTARVRGRHRLADSVIALQLPANVRVSSAGGDQFGVAVLQGEHGICFAQACARAGNTCVEVYHAALEPNVIYTVSLQMTLEVVNIRNDN